MSLESDLVDYLRGDAAVAALLGARIWFQEIPQDSAYPNAVMYRIDGVPNNTLAGSGGKSRVRVQIDVYGQTYAATKAAAAAVVSALRASGGSPSTGLDGALQLSDQDFYDAQVNLHRTSMDWRFLVSE